VVLKVRGGGRGVPAAVRRGGRLRRQQCLVRRALVLGRPRRLRPPVTFSVWWPLCSYLNGELYGELYWRHIIRSFPLREGAHGGGERGRVQDVRGLRPEAIKLRAAGGEESAVVLWLCEGARGGCEHKVKFTGLTENPYMRLRVDPDSGSTL
jgi:hypothetical protein